jgi:hypothetical protein
MYTAKTMFLLSLLLAALAANAADQQRQINGTPRFAVLPGGNVTTAMKQSALTANIPLWSGSFVSAGTTYNFTMVGADPTTSNATTKIPVVIIPLVFKFGHTTISPGTSACGDTTSALTRVGQSPILRDFPFVEGTTNIGTTQYPDAFQRANFWQSVGSVTPKYHTRLAPVTQEPKQTINVPSTVGGILGFGCGGTRPIGGVDINFVDAQLQALLTLLAIPSTSLPIFVSYDVFETAGGCCILGYHSSTAGSQTYLIAAYSDPGLFSVPIEDIHALSHEVGEWLDDPFGNNIVPTWGNVGQVSGCQNNLEVGDPVTGIAFTATLNGFTYHPEDLVFFSWFARQSPSIAVNGWYTFLNTFNSPSATCP